MAEARDKILARAQTGETPGESRDGDRREPAADEKPWFISIKVHWR
jgi:hypothetical protein